MYIQHYIYKLYCLQPTLSSANLSWSGTTGSRASCHECQWTFSLGLCPKISRMKGLRLVEVDFGWDLLIFRCLWWFGSPKIWWQTIGIYIPIVPIRSMVCSGKIGSLQDDIYVNNFRPSSTCSASGAMEDYSLDSFKIDTDSKTWFFSEQWNRYTICLGIMLYHIQPQSFREICQKQPMQKNIQTSTLQVKQCQVSPSPLDDTTICGYREWVCLSMPVCTLAHHLGIHFNFQPIWDVKCFFLVVALDGFSWMTSEDSDPQSFQRFSWPWLVSYDIGGLWYSISLKEGFERNPFSANIQPIWGYHPVIQFFSNIFFLRKFRANRNSES